MKTSVNVEICVSYNSHNQIEPQIFWHLNFLIQQRFHSIRKKNWEKNSLTFRVQPWWTKVLRYGLENECFRIFCLRLPTLPKIIIRISDNYLRIFQKYKFIYFIGKKLEAEIIPVNDLCKQLILFQHIQVILIFQIYI